jgi:hypothetical protein
MQRITTAFSQGKITVSIVTDGQEFITCGA